MLYTGFPDELLLLVFSFLDSPCDRLRVLRVCRRWRAIGVDGMLWRDEAVALRHAVPLANAWASTRGRGGEAADASMTDSDSEGDEDASSVRTSATAPTGGRLRIALDVTRSLRRELQAAARVNMTLRHLGSIVWRASIEDVSSSEVCTILAALEGDVIRQLGFFQIPMDHVAPLPLANMPHLHHVSWSSNQPEPCAGLFGYATQLHSLKLAQPMTELQLFGIHAPPSGLRVLEGVATADYRHAPVVGNIPSPKKTLAYPYPSARRLVIYHPNNIPPVEAAQAGALVALGAATQTDNRGFATTYVDPALKQSMTIERADSGASDILAVDD